jgi:hypothetical protein
MSDIVKLLRPDGVEVDFELGHAERLMAMPDNGGWELVDANFEMVGNEIVRRRRKKTAEPANADEQQLPSEG